jgi:hypothetical protein
MQPAQTPAICSWLHDNLKERSILTINYQPWGSISGQQQQTAGHHHTTDMKTAAMMHPKTACRYDLVG